MISRLGAKRDEVADELKTVFTNLSGLRSDFAKLKWDQQNVALFLERIESVLDETLAHQVFAPAAKI